MLQRSALTAECWGLKDLAAAAADLSIPYRVRSAIVSPRPNLYGEAPSRHYETTTLLCYGALVIVALILLETSALYKLFTYGTYLLYYYYYYYYYYY